MAILGLGNTELLVILVVFLLLFGATAIPKLARSMGRAKGEFVKAKGEFDREAAKAAAGTAVDGTPATGGADEAQVRKTARELGIAEQGKPLDQVKREIQQKLA